MDAGSRSGERGVLVQAESLREHLEGHAVADVGEFSAVEVVSDAFRGRLLGRSSQTKRAAGSMNRLISQALARRSTQGLARVAQVRGLVRRAIGRAQPAARYPRLTRR